MPRGVTAAQLADALNTLSQPGATSEAALAAMDASGAQFAHLSETLRVMSAEFHRRVEAHRQSYDQGVKRHGAEETAAVQQFAVGFGNALRAYGDLGAFRCLALAWWGMCDTPMQPEGECPKKGDHQPPTPYKTSNSWG